MTQGSFTLGVLSVGLILAVGALIFAYTRGRVLLQFYQQEEYDTRRFTAWLVRRRACDKKATLVVLTTAIAALAFESRGAVLADSVLWLFGMAVFGALAVGTLSNRGLVRHAKKPLVMTQRALRILSLYLILIVGSLASASVHGVFYDGGLSFWTGLVLIFFQAPPFVLVLANGILRPYDKHTNQRYIKEAKIRLSSIGAQIIAITGSYGKTSTKHMLGHILSAVAPTLVTPASINTELGITRLVREELRPRHKYFVVEMGAYGKGSIARLCRLAQPTLGIITAVGVAHLERFGSPEAVFHTKFELAHDVAARGGKTIVNVDMMPRALLEAETPKTHNLVLCGSAGGAFPLSLTLASFEQTKKGLSLSVKFGSDILELKVPLYGEHNAANIMLAVAAAFELGVAPDVVRAALASLPQFPHRLEVIQGAKGITIIDDAYNSNPKGFENALKILTMMAEGKGRRILITPGMVELGDAHDEEHEKLGRIAAQHVDVALLVGSKRLSSFIRAYKNLKSENAELHVFETQREADAWAHSHARPGDALLFENNLPDLYEATVTF